MPTPSGLTLFYSLHIHRRGSLVPNPSFSIASFILVKASKIPFHASRSTLLSCKPRLLLAPSELEPGSWTPSDGGRKPGGAQTVQIAPRLVVDYHLDHRFEEVE
ncbi:hypothetical protein WG66_015790 [Moniliophthora roreri]|nr:hypothetical protein WG66_015790 [Moniliophthora roreri]